MRMKYQSSENSGFVNHTYFFNPNIVDYMVYLSYEHQKMVDGILAVAHEDDKLFGIIRVR